MRGYAEMTIWVTGTPKRESLHVDDCADALVYLMKSYSTFEQINARSGEDLAVLELKRLVCEMIGFIEEIVSDLSKPTARRGS